MQEQLETTSVKQASIDSAANQGDMLPLPPIQTREKYLMGLILVPSYETGTS
jgi:hypothetical protein